MILGFKSPIPKTISDAGELLQAYDTFDEVGRRFSIVPRFGDDLGYSQMITDIYKSLSLMSPAHNACKSQITEWVMGNYVDVKRDTFPGLIENTPVYERGEDGYMMMKEGKTEVVPFSEKKVFAKKLAKYGIDMLKITSLVRSIESTQMGDMSSAFVKITVTNVGGVKKVSFAVLDYPFCHVVDTGGKRGLMLMYAPTLDTTMWVGDLKPKMYHLSNVYSGFRWKHTKRKSETVLQLSRGSFGYYGDTPLMTPILYHMYNEIVLGETTTKLVGSEFIAKILIALEQPGRRKGDKSASDYMRAQAEGLRKITSTEPNALGDGNAHGKTIGFMSYPKGGKAPEVSKIGVNRDTAWLESVTRISSDEIFSQHQWHPQLTGFKDFKSGLGGGILLDLYTTADAKLIRPKQEYYEQVFSKIFNELGSILGEDFGYTIMPVRQIETLLFRLGMIKRTN